MAEGEVSPVTQYALKAVGNNSYNKDREALKTKIQAKQKEINDIQNNIDLVTKQGRTLPNFDLKTAGAQKAQKERELNELMAQANESNATYAQSQQWLASSNDWDTTNGEMATTGLKTLDEYKKAIDSGAAEDIRNSLYKELHGKLGNDVMYTRDNKLYINNNNAEIQRAKNNSSWFPGGKKDELVVKLEALKYADSKLSKTGYVSESQEKVQQQQTSQASIDNAARNLYSALNSRGTSIQQAQAIGTAFGQLIVACDSLDEQTFESKYSAYVKKALEKFRAFASDEDALLVYAYAFCSVLNLPQHKESLSILSSTYKQLTGAK